MTVPVYSTLNRLGLAFGFKTTSIISGALPDGVGVLGADAGIARPASDRAQERCSATLNL
jgi:hypothetical protein